MGTDWRGVGPLCRWQPQVPSKRLARREDLLPRALLAETAEKSNAKHGPRLNFSAEIRQRRASRA